MPRRDRVRFLVTLRCRVRGVPWTCEVLAVSFSMAAREAQGAAARRWSAHNYRVSTVERL